MHDRVIVDNMSDFEKKAWVKKKNCASEEEISTLPSLRWSPMSSITVQGENHIQVSPVSFCISSDA